MTRPGIEPRSSEPLASTRQVTIFNINNLQLYIKYSYLIQIIHTQLWGFKYSYLILIITGFQVIIILRERLWLQVTILSTNNLHTVIKFSCISIK